ncbi:class I SAM-dependent methyltransferase [Patescibacteria group bacterium]|nr:class I SAM-dependent methyltransferase [Patescibacteria group bacterium]MBU1727897.1 class I SAM-dependent methyltransferase [Patescibacteria group bacterium]
MLKKILRKVKLKYCSITEQKQHQKFLKVYSNLKQADDIFTHLTTAEKRKLFELASKIDNGYAVEIGSFVGASACFLSAGMNNSTKLICIDTWENDAMSEGKRDTKKEFDENTQTSQTKIIKVQGYSTNVVEDIKAITQEIDLLFIDGDHSYEGCKADWDLYSPYLKSGSCVIFHDCGWAEGVRRVIEEDAKPLMSSYGSLPNMFWGYIK